MAVVLATLVFVANSCPPLTASVEVAVRAPAATLATTFPPMSTVALEPTVRPPLAVTVPVKVGLATTPTVMAEPVLVMATFEPLTKFTVPPGVTLNLLAADPLVVTFQPAPASVFSAVMALPTLL